MNEKCHCVDCPREPASREWQAHWCGLTQQYKTSRQTQLIGFPGNAFLYPSSRLHSCFAYNHRAATVYTVYIISLTCGPWTAAFRENSSAHRASGRRENHSTHHVLMLGEGMVPPFPHGHPKKDCLTKQFLLALRHQITQRAP